MSEGACLPMPGADTPLRRCALTLHAVGARDRHWLMAKLAEHGRRAELERLLEELQSLGIPPDARMVRLALEHGRTALTPASSAAVAGHLAMTAPAKDLAKVLQDEPAGLIVHVMSLRGDLDGAFLDRLNATTRRQVQELLSTAQRHSPAAAPRLNQALLEQLSIRLSRHMARSPVRFANSIAARVRSQWAALAKTLP